jgi:hypothetical protein
MTNDGSMNVPAASGPVNDGGLPPEDVRAEDAAVFRKPRLDEAERVLRERKCFTEERQAVPARR